MKKGIEVLSLLVKSCCTRVPVFVCVWRDQTKNAHSFVYHGLNTNFSFVVVLWWVMSIYIFNYLPTVFLSYFTVSSLFECQLHRFFGFLSGSIQVRQSVQAMFSLAQQYGDILREGWKNLLDCLLALFKAKLLPDTMVEVWI